MGMRLASNVERPDEIMSAVSPCYSSHGMRTGNEISTNIYVVSSLPAALKIYPHSQAFNHS